MESALALPRFYPILDTGLAERRRIAIGDAAAAILEAGARILQLRHKGPFTRAVFDAALGIGRECARRGVLWIVNDRADMAALLGAGLHLGQDDLPPSEVRRICSGPIGYSTHNEPQLREAAGEPADYLALGPIFGTTSKENPDPVVGVEQLRAWRGLTARPLVAIGGITRANARQVLGAGADSLAVIGDLYPEGEGLDGLRKRTREWLELTA